MRRYKTSTSSCCLTVPWRLLKWELRGGVQRDAPRLAPDTRLLRNLLGASPTAVQTVPRVPYCLLLASHVVSTGPVASPRVYPCAGARDALASAMTFPLPSLPACSPRRSRKPRRPSPSSGLPWARWASRRRSRRPSGASWPASTTWEPPGPVKVRGAPASPFLTPRLGAGD